MKSQTIFKLINLSLALFLFLSCNKKNDNPIVISLGPATEVTETSFKVTWSISTTEVKKISVVISLSKTFEPIEKEVNVSDLNQTSIVIDQMHGATIYYYKLKVFSNEESFVESEVKNVTTSYKSVSVYFNTSDGIRIAGILQYLESVPKNSKGIIFMHELTRSADSWKNTNVVINLVAQGYECLLINFRGHGNSGSYPLPANTSEIETFINVISKDLIASVNFMRSNHLTDSIDLALVGASMGGSIAIAGNGFDEVKASIALSAVNLGINSIFPTLYISSAFFIAGELDKNSQVDFPNEANSLYQISSEPKKIKILPGNSGHGTILLSSPEVSKDIVDWINARMAK